MSDIPFGAWVAFAGLIVTILLSTGGIMWALVWKISDITGALKDSTETRVRLASEENARKIHDLRKDLMQKVAEMHLDLDNQVEASRLRTGEIGEALRSKITQLEFYVRDEFKLYVLKEDFRDDLKTITAIVDTLGTRIEKRLESFEGKLDELQKFNMKSV